MSDPSRYTGLGQDKDALSQDMGVPVMSQTDFNSDQSEPAPAQDAIVSNPTKDLMDAIGPTAQKVAPQPKPINSKISEPVLRYMASQGDSQAKKVLDDAYGPELNDAALKQALINKGNKEDSLDMNILAGEAGNLYARNQGYTGNFEEISPYTKNKLQHVGGDVEDIETRRKAMDQELKRQGETLDLSDKKQTSDPASDVSKAARDFAKSKLGLNVGDNVSFTALKPIMDETRTFKQFEDNIAARKEMSKDKSLDRQAMMEERSKQNEEKVLSKLTDNLKNDLDPNKARGGNLAKSQAMINSAERVEGLLSQFPDGNVPTAQTHELASAVAGLVSGGGNGPQSQQQINAIVPHSMRGDAQRIAAWITNEPLGQQQQKFMKLLGETAAREKNIALNQVRQAQVQRVSAYDKLKNSDPNTYNSILHSYGIDPEEIQNGKYDSKSIAQPKSNDFFPKQVRNGNQIATVSNAQELAEAKKEGFN